MKERCMWQGQPDFAIPSLNIGVKMALEHPGGKGMPRLCGALSWRQNWGRGLGHRPTVFLLNGLCLSAGLSLPA